VRGERTGQPDALRCQALIEAEVRLQVNCAVEVFEALDRSHAQRASEQLLVQHIAVLR